VKISKNKANSSTIMKQTDVSSAIGHLQPKNRPFTDRFIIGPDNKINSAFSFILIFLALFSTLFSAFYACFGAP